MRRDAATECRPPVVGPGHLEDARKALHAFNVQSLAKALSARKVLNEVADREEEGGTLLCR
jgi:hypothetical protein